MTEPARASSAGAGEACPLVKWTRSACVHGCIAGSSSPVPLPIAHSPLINDTCTSACRCAIPSRVCLLFSNPALQSRQPRSLRHRSPSPFPDLCFADYRSSCCLSRQSKSSAVLRLLLLGLTSSRPGLRLLAKYAQSNWSLVGNKSTHQLTLTTRLRRHFLCVTHHKGQCARAQPPQQSLPTHLRI